ncbi:hypothetical protein H8959_006532 [Pygathrix nigripes]
MLARPQVSLDPRPLSAICLQKLLEAHEEQNCGQLHRVGEWPAWGSGPFTGMGPLGKPPFSDTLSPDIHPFLSGPQPTVNFFLQSPQKPHK